jgi:hypothetical protein
MKGVSLNPLKLLTRPEATPAADGLEAVLTGLARCGKPRLFRMSDGWYCGVEMNTTALGASFEVKSEFNHGTPLEAAAECRRRVDAALRAVGGSLSK